MIVSDQAPPIMFTSFRPAITGGMQPAGTLTLRECSRCGAVVTDTSRHEAWHLEQAGSRPD